MKARELAPDSPEFLGEATQEFWNIIAEEFPRLQRDVQTDPQRVLRVCQFRKRNLQSFVPEDPEEELLVEVALQSYDKLIEEARRRLGQQP